MKRYDRAQRFRFYAHRAGYDRRDVARIMDLTDQCVWTWFTGRSFPSVETLERFCALVGVDLPTFFGPLPERIRSTRRTEVRE